MFDIGGSEALIIVLAILLLFGAKRIPDLARSMGAGIREFRRAMADISTEVQNATSVDPAPPHRSLAPVLPPPESSLPQLTTILEEQRAAREGVAGAPPAPDASGPQTGAPGPASAANPAVPTNPADPAGPAAPAGLSGPTK